MTKVTRGTKTSQIPMVTDNRSDPVTVSSDLRKAHRWFDEQCVHITEEAIRSQRVKLRKGKPRLSSARLQRVILAHERIQQALNPLLKRQERLTNRLKAHYGHTGEMKFVSPLGETLVSLSMTLGVDSQALRLRLNEDVWNQLIERVLQPGLLLPLAKDDAYLRAAIERSTKVVQLKVTVTAPSSRRPKSGKVE